MIKRIKKYGNLLRLKKKLKELKQPIDSKTAKEIGKMLISEIRAMTEKGISPVRDGGVGGSARFTKYKNPKKYPGDKKRQRPVNLRLTGDMMKSLKYDIVQNPKTGNDTDIYYSGNNYLKERGHREGVHGQPKRVTIPKENEQFAVRILRQIKKIYGNRVKLLLKK